MWEVNARNAARKGITLEAQTRAFNAMFKPAGAKRLQETRPWVTQLTREGTEPADWKLVWADYQDRWLAYVAAADGFLAAVKAGTYRQVCKAAHDYGGRCTNDRGVCDRVRQCYRPVLCMGGKTHQAYWNVSQCWRERRDRARDVTLTR